MALLNAKILETERNAVYVKSVPGERLTGNVQQNKDVFDKFPQLIMGKYNDLVDLLISLNLDNITTDLSDRYTKTEADAKITEETNSLVANVTINTDTGVITVTKKDGTSQSVDTALEKVPATFEFVEDIENDKYYLKITNVDGSTSQTEVTNLMNQFTFTSGDIVTFSQSANGTTTTITASIKAGSIGFNELKSEVKAYIDTKAADISADKEIVLAAKTEVLNASQSVTANTTIVLNAKDDATAQANKAKSYAVGGTGTREGEDTDNAQYYSNQANLRANDAHNSAVAAEEAKNKAQEIVGGDFLTKTGNGSNLTATFTETASRTNIATGEKLSVIFGKIKKFFSDLKSVAFSGDYTDLINTPAPEIFIATYGTTTPEEIGVAYDAGKAVFCKKNNLFAPLARGNLKNTWYVFTFSFGNQNVTLQCNNGNWSTSSIEVPSITTTTATLTVDGWEVDGDELKQTVAVSMPISGYIYTTYPNSSQYKAWCEAGIYAEDVATADRITFRCSDKPTAEITVNIKKEQVT